MINLIQLVMMGMSLNSAHAAVDCNAIDLSGSYVEMESFAENDYLPNLPIDQQFDETYLNTVNYLLKRDASGAYQFKFDSIDENYASLLKLVGIDAGEVADQYKQFEPIAGNVIASGDECVLKFGDEVFAIYAPTSKTLYRLDTYMSQGKEKTIIHFIKGAATDADDDVFNH